MIPNIDIIKPHHRPGVRATVANGQPADVDLDPRPRRTVRGKLRIPKAVEWCQHGTGLLASCWRGIDTPHVALFAYVRWEDDAGRTGRLPLDEFLALPLDGGDHAPNV